MGHHGDTYEQFYMPNLIKRDFQSIYFGTPSQEDLIWSIARMGLSRDKRAPTTLTDEQKLEVKHHPDLVRLREKRERYNKKLQRLGYHPVEAGTGTSEYAFYEKYKRKANSKANALRNKRLEQAIKDFHDSIDTIEIDRQLDGTNQQEILTPQITRQELRERANVARLMSKSMADFDDERALRMRIRFTQNLADLYAR
ncbi:hypothetical protein BU26DRAFT_500479 [Trematosphaeria pertusa]|uniref:Uncharacterized protein n=1 Tax=Trematosphaeria pertusa TaxID=390896 RepID=A0A6A6IXY7_9PLEO|nr:uncharacterized protein BU26DRAFT_500479 [Trematosphaeria pertusa]KAF2254792.1 hypothetical protein BU26DRAFT_500479 [Trematosphaeria pertusa]